MFRIRNKDWDCFLEYRSFTDNLIASKFLYCNKNYQKDFDENFKKKFLDTYKFWLGGNHIDLYVQSDTLLLASVLENFWNMCLKTYEFNPAHFFPNQG